MARNIEAVRREVRMRYQELRNWRRVGLAMGISEGMAWRIANEAGYEPKEAHLRVRLGLPALVPAPVCVKCGEVHVAKRCTARRRVARDLWEMPVEELRQAVENRKDWDTDEHG